MSFPGYWQKLNDLPPPFPHPSDHKPVVFKILSSPSVSEPRPILDYKHANWPLFKYTLNRLIVTNPHTSDRRDPEHKIQDVSSAVRQAAHTAIPYLTVRRYHLTLPPSLVNLMKIKKTRTKVISDSRIPPVSSPSLTYRPCSHLQTVSTTKF